VNSVLPGPTRSRGVGDFVEQLAREQGTTGAQVEKEFFAHVRPTSLIKRFIDHARSGVDGAYLASPLASSTTGAALRVEWRHRQERLLGETHGAIDSHRRGRGRFGPGHRRRAAQRRRGQSRRDIPELNQHPERLEQMLDSTDDA
jgi:hypothetical protein